MLRPNQLSWLWIAVLLNITGFSLPNKTTWKLDMEHHFIHVRDRNEPLTMLCTLRYGDGERVPLAGCEARSYYEKTTWDLNRGPNSLPINKLIKDRPTFGKYHGTGLQNGDCGLKVTGLRHGYSFILGCRVRPAVGGAWQYAAMMVYIDVGASMQYELQPAGVLVAQLGSDVLLIGTAEHQLDSCLLYLPPDNTQLDLDKGHASKYNAQFLAELQRNQCRVTLHSVVPESSGFVRSQVWSSATDTLSSDFMELIVAKAPSLPPILTLISPPNLLHGDMLHARCAVGKSSPVANITWFLGDEVVKEDKWNEAPPEADWQWNHQPQRIEQQLSRHVTAQDDGKKLKCRAGHLAIPSGFQDSNIITITVSELCKPNPCGPNSECRVDGRYIQCFCLPKFIGMPKNCRPECVSSSDCPADKECIDNVCQDSCTGKCGQNALCTAVDHIPLCRCPDGWIGKPDIRCEEEPCGVRNVFRGLIAGGHTATRGEFPWHAALFETGRNESYKMLCGGTLIRPNIVITAAHCIYDEAHRILKNNTSVKVVLGKRLLDWDADINNTDVQRLDVDAMLVPEEYGGSLFDYRYDIAILKLSTSAILTTEVNVACVDWSKSFDQVQLRKGRNATVAGWGITLNTSKRSPVLQWIDLPFVDQRTCRSSTSLHTRKYVTNDKFCAGYILRSRSVCPGDSGGGLLFRNDMNDRYYLRGVVSTSLAYNVQPSMCSADHYTAFTSLGDYVEWIKEYINLHK